MAGRDQLKEPSETVFLGGLDSRVNDKLLYELACQAGPVKNVRICGRSEDEPNKRLYAFVAYDGLDSAMYAVGLFRGKVKLFGCPVSVNFSNDTLDIIDQPEDVQLLWKKCTAVLDSEGCIRRSEPMPPPRPSFQTPPPARRHSYDDDLRYDASRGLPPHPQSAPQLTRSSFSAAAVTAAGGAHAWGQGSAYPETPMQQRQGGAGMGGESSQSRGDHAVGSESSDYYSHTPHGRHQQPHTPHQHQQQPPPPYQQQQQQQQQPVMGGYHPHQHHHQPLPPKRMVRQQSGGEAYGHVYSAHQGTDMQVPNHNWQQQQQHHHQQPPPQPPQQQQWGQGGAAAVVAAAPRAPTLAPGGVLGESGGQFSIGSVMGAGFSGTHHHLQQQQQQQQQGGYALHAVPQQQQQQQQQQVGLAGAGVAPYVAPQLLGVTPQVVVLQQQQPQQDGLAVGGFASSTWGTQQQPQPPQQQQPGVFAGLVPYQGHPQQQQQQQHYSHSQQYWSR